MAVCIIYCCFCEYIILYRFVVYILKINLLVGCSVLMVILSTIIFPPPFFLSLSWETFILCGSSSNQCLSNSGFLKVLSFIFSSVWHLSSHCPPPKIFIILLGVFLSVSPSEPSLRWNHLSFLKMIYYCEIWGSHSSVTEDSSFMGCYAVMIGKQVLIFRRIVVPSCLELSIPGMNFFCITWHWWSFLLTLYQSTQHNTTENYHLFIPLHSMDPNEVKETFWI